MEYTLRKLKSTDLFIVSKIISKIGLKEIKKAISTDTDLQEFRANLEGQANISDKQLESYGLNIMVSVGDLVLSKLELVENELFTFIAGVTSLKVKDVQDMLITDFAELVIEILKMPDFTDFIKVVLKLPN